MNSNRIGIQLPLECSGLRKLSASLEVRKKEVWGKGWEDGLSQTQRPICILSTLR